MKKSVALIVLAIYILSIVIVGFFGMKVSFFEERIYASQIVCINDELSVMPDGRKTIVMYFTPDENGEHKYQLAWRVLPDIATNKEVKFYYTDTGKFSVSDKGVVTFFINTTATIQIVAQDGSNKKEEIQFILRRQV
ncbi:MAG: hypothetical protein WCR30_04175 [Clostridia bacterium]